MSKKNAATVQEAPAQRAQPTAQDTAHDWVSDAQVSSEEMPGAGDYEAQAEYGLAMEFAALQVRARAHTKSVWRDYEMATAQVEVLDGVLRELDEQPDSVNPFTRRVITEHLRALGKQRSEAFEIWADLSKLANAEGLEDLNTDDTRRGVSALHAAENRKAEELLQMQDARRERVRKHQEADALAAERNDAAHN